MPYSAYLFDFDYTLADSSAGIVKCFQLVLKKNQFTDVTDEQIKRTIGKTLEESFSILTAITDPEHLLELKKQYSEQASIYMTPNTFFYPDTIPVLKKLKAEGIKLGIISTKYRYRIQEMMDLHFPADWLDLIIGGEDVERAKPDPQGIRAALERLQLPTEKVLYIGDSTIDAEAAQNAGVNFVGVTSGMTTQEELAAYPHERIICRLGELIPSIVN